MVTPATAMPQHRHGVSTSGMPEDVVLSARGVSKKFCRNLRRSMAYGIADLTRNLMGLRSDRGTIRRDEFWALRDINLEVRRGQTLGIIGANGSGKTTLLRLLAGIFPPDKGEVAARGRVGALIALGAGFHPLMTGRENVYLNGAILGMRRWQLEEKFKAITDFAQIGEFIDAPVSTYSSGMRVRLGFSIAIHVDPDVLLVDEVLAVGDADFRSKSMDRMWGLVSSGRAGVVFVSHNMQAVAGLCQRVVLLDKGAMHTGDKAELMARYSGSDVSQRFLKVRPDVREQLLAESSALDRFQSGDIEVTSVQITDMQGRPDVKFRPDEAMRIHVSLRTKKRLGNVISTVAFRDLSGLLLSAERSHFHGMPPMVMDGPHELEIVVDPLQLRTGTYVLVLVFQEPTLEVAYGVFMDATFDVLDPLPTLSGRDGFFKPRVRWTFQGSSYGP